MGKISRRGLQLVYRREVDIPSHVDPDDPALILVDQRRDIDRAVQHLLGELAGVGSG